MKIEPVKKIFPAEFAAELKEFLVWCQRNGRDPSDVLVVALQPEVSVLCRSEGLPHVDTLSFFDNAAQKRILIKSHELTSLISRELSFKAEGSIENVLIDTFIFHSRFYINHLLWIIEILKGIKRSGSYEICLFKKSQLKAPHSVGNDPLLSNQDHYVGEIAAKYCVAHQLPMEAIADSAASPSPVGKGIGRRFEPVLSRILKKLYQRALANLSGEKTVFITAPSYNLDRLAKDLQTRFPEIVSVTNVPEFTPSGSYLNVGLGEVFKLLAGRIAPPALLTIPTKIFNGRRRTQEKKTLSEMKKAFKKFAGVHHRAFSHENCSFWDEFERKVESGLLDYLAGLRATAAGQKEFLASLRPGLVISAMSLGEYQSWAEVSHSLGIPALVIPQKMMVAPSDPYAKIEEYYLGRAQVTGSYRNAASQSPNISRYLSWSRYEGNILETGNLIFSRIDPAERKKRRRSLFKDNGRGTKIIVWAPSIKSRRSRRFYVLETLDELIDAMKDVFKIISGMESVHLVFRIHPGRAITKDQILALTSVPDNVSICEGGAFEEVLSIADLLLSFSSTSILESLMNRIPVVLYDKWKRYNHLDVARVENSVPLRKSSVYYIDDTKILASSLPWILNAHTGEESSEGLFSEYLTKQNGIDNFYDFVGNCLELRAGSASKDHVLP